MAKRKTVEEDEPTFIVTVWNTMDGDIIKKLWEATQSEVDDIEERYGDEPFYLIEVQDRS